MYIVAWKSIHEDSFGDYSITRKYDSFAEAQREVKDASKRFAFLQHFIFELIPITEESLPVTHQALLQALLEIADSVEYGACDGLKGRVSDLLTPHKSANSVDQEASHA